MEDITIEDTHLPSESLITLLKHHLPHSLDVLRRLQFANLEPRASTPTSHVLFVYFTTSPPTPENTTIPFAAAHIDLSFGPNQTEAVLYSTLEDYTFVNGPDDTEIRFPSSSDKDEDQDKNTFIARSTTLTLALLRRARHLALTHPPQETDGSSHGHSEEFILGSLNETLRQQLLAAGVRMRPTVNVPPEEAAAGRWDLYGKWLFRLEHFPPDGEGRGRVLRELPAGMRWDVVRRGDLAVVRERSAIRRVEETMLMLPSVAIRLDDGTPVAWAFMGLHGTLITLHCEEAYRGRGLAKAVACRLMREYVPWFGDDGWGATDVFVENLQSQGVCRSIGGRVGWPVSCRAVVDLTSAGEPM